MVIVAVSLLCDTTAFLADLILPAMITPRCAGDYRISPCGAPVTANLQCARSCGIECTNAGAQKFYRRYFPISTDAHAEQLREWAVQLSGDYLPDDWQRVSSSASTRVAVNPTLQLYYKEYLPRSPAAALRAQVKGSRATRARLNAEALLQAGIDAPHNVLWGQLPGGGEYLYTVAAPGDSIQRWLCETLAGRNAEQLRLRRQLLHALGTFIGRVHATGFIHGELRPDNVLAALVKDQFRFTLINNEGNTQRIPTPGKLLLRNLVQMNSLPLAVLGRTDRMRFLRAWRRQMRDLSPMEGKILAAEAYHRALRKLPAKPP